VVLQLDREVEFKKSVLESPDRIYFDLEEVRLDSRLVDQKYDVNGLFLKQIRVGENRPRVVRVVLDFQKIHQHTIFALYDPFRIVIDTRGAFPRTTDANREAARGKGDEAAGAEESEDGLVATDIAPSPTLQGNLTLTRTLGLKVGKVVIDPGHGGKDTGTIGAGGLLEKNLVLDVAQRLRRMLIERLGTEVILTRQDDSFVPLEERTAIANQNSADLFISIHANASRNRRVSGVETYVLDFATNEAEREVASRENASAQKNIRELEDLLRQIALEDYNQESRDLAHVVQHNLVSDLSDHLAGNRDRGVKQAPFIVLIGSAMPSILAEVGFISHPASEEYFLTQESRDQVAEALYKGIEDYFHSLGAVVASRQRSAAASVR
jgi:N-acetylmuramoyl-L-alanine amidase